MNWYYKLLAKRPLLIIIAVSVFSVACIVVSLTTKKLPSFDDPTLGFEARGTSIGQRLTAWKNLIEETRPSGSLIANPKDLFDQGVLMAQHKPSKFKVEKVKIKKQNKLNYNKKIKIIKEIAINKSNYDTINEEYDYNDTFSNNRHGNWEYGKNLSYTSDEETNKKLQLKKDQWFKLLTLNPPLEPKNELHISDGIFCDSPNKEYAHFVVQKINNFNESLFDLKSLYGICELEQRLSKINYYNKLCQKELNSNNCCKMWTLPNYISLLSNKTLCSEIDDNDVLNVKILLIECFQYYHNLKLSNDCTENKCRVPPECAQHNAVYNILHYLTDIDFIKLNSTNIYLNASMIFVPIARSTPALPYYYMLKDENLSNDIVAIVAMDMGLKNALFDECLISDGWLIGIGGLFVILCIWLYTTSFFITIMTVVAVIFSLGIGYFVYTLIYELKFFPFMNLLVIVVIIGIGADDAFIFLKIWNCVISDRVKSSGVPLTSASSYCSDVSRADTLSSLMAETLKHASVSMLVTSITTSAAFFASYSSSITAVQCFGIFAGTVVIANYLLMVTWLPAAVSVAERLTFLKTENLFKTITNTMYLPFKSLCQLGQSIEEAIISAIISYSKIWIIILGLVGIVSGVMVFYYPQLQLPDSPDFKLFVSNHPFEMYDSIYKNYFWFEKSYTSTDNFRLPLRFVWGVLPVDNGDYLDPQSKGKIIMDDSFNISNPESQLWLLNFCHHLKNESFYQATFGLFGLLPHCFIENFISFMGRRCYDDMSDQDRTPCCEISTFPFTSTIFNRCLPESISSIYETPREYFIPGVAGPKFSKEQFEKNTNNLTNNNNNSNNMPLVTTLVIEYDSTQLYTMSYIEVENFVKNVEEWMLNELKTAPDEMKNGWFISDLEFYDLQNTLSTGTLIAICMSMCVALLVLLLVTLNILISLYAIITVTFTIFTTVAIIVVLGWKLNVLESVAVSTAIGLAVDFSLHYGVQYRLSPDLDRVSSARYSLSRMIGPTAMAAITTGAAGAFMLPSKVLPYIQIGIFLIVVMANSWMFATFFLMSLLSVIGPQYGFGQFQFPKIRNSRESKNLKTQLDSNNRIHDNQCTVSEQLLSASSSAAGDLVGSESHELEALTPSSVIKPISALECVRPINFDRAFIKKKFSYPKEQSPSTVSAITVVMPDDSDINN